MKRLVYLISTFLILTGMYGGAGYGTSEKLSDGDIWKIARYVDEPDMYREYLERYPTGGFVQEAKERIKELHHFG